MKDERSLRVLGWTDGHRAESKSLVCVCLHLKAEYETVNVESGAHRYIGVGA